MFLKENLDFFKNTAPSSPFFRKKVGRRAACFCPKMKRGHFGYFHWDRLGNRTGLVQGIELLSSREYDWSCIGNRTGWSGLGATGLV